MEMMEMNDVLLVTCNYKGLCEKNFLTTIDEFIKEHSVDDLYGGAYVDTLKNLVSNAEPYKWAGGLYTRPNVSYDLRRCQSTDDLLKFLSGEYNDSPENADLRLPGSLKSYEHFYWENSADLFSTLAVDVIVQNFGKNDPDFEFRLLNVMPDFPKKSGLQNDRKPSLSDIIKTAHESRTLKKVVENNTVELNL